MNNNKTNWKWYLISILSFLGLIALADVGYRYNCFSYQWFPYYGNCILPVRAQKNTVTMKKDPQRIFFICYPYRYFDNNANRNK